MSPSVGRLSISVSLASERQDPLLLIIGEVPVRGFPDVPHISTKTGGSDGKLSGDKREDADELSSTAEQTVKEFEDTKFVNEIVELWAQ